MSPLDWFKKEKPLLGLLGMGGGGSGEAAAFEITGGTKHTTPSIVALIQEILSSCPLPYFADVILRKFCTCTPSYI